MIDPPVEIVNLSRARKISSIPPDTDFAEQHLRRAGTTVDQALLLTDPGLQERLRYEAGLHLALALMAHDGYRLRSGPGHHETALLYLRARIGADRRMADAARVLDMARRNRNGELYRAVEVGTTSAEASASALDTLLAGVTALIGTPD